MPFRRLELLTPREREVLEQIVGGASNKETGRKLGISPRTIEVHRARIMDKLGAKNAADLVRIVLSQDRGTSRRHARAERPFDGPQTGAALIAADGGCPLPRGGCCCAPPKRC